MPIRIYRLTSASGVSTTGAAATIAIQRGRIKQVALTHAIVGGAGTGRLSFECALNNTANGNSETATGAPSENLLGRLNTACGNGVIANQTQVFPVDIPIAAGNSLCLNILQTGTAPATAISGADVYVME